MRRILLLAALVVLCAAPVHGQAFSVYVTSANSRFTNVQTGSVLTTSGFQNRYTNFWASGIGGGVTLGLVPVGPIRFGLDLRGSTKPGTTGADTAMLGFKLAVKPPLLPIKPYIQASGGYVATRTVNVSTTSITSNQTVGGTFNNKYAGWEILGGLDMPLAPFVDLRLVEVGGGAAYGVTNNPPSISMFSINSGLVVHF